MTMVHYNS